MNIKELQAQPWTFEKRGPGCRWKKVVKSKFRFSGVSEAVVLYTKDSKMWVCYFDPPFQELNYLLHSPLLLGTDDEVKLQVDQLIDRVVNLMAFY